MYGRRVSNQKYSNALKKQHWRKNRCEKTDRIYLGMQKKGGGGRKKMGVDVGVRQ